MSRHTGSSCFEFYQCYSRQNLLSSNSCKSNEDSCTFSTNICTNNNINNQIQRNNSNVNNFNNNSNNASGSSGSGAGGSAGTKYPHNLNRNNSFSNVNQQNAATDLGPNISGHQQPSQNYQTIPQQSHHHQQQQQQPQQDGAQFPSMDQSPFLQQQQQQQLQPQAQQQQQQQQHQHQHHHTPLSQSTSFDLGELQFHTNPINLGLANKSGHPKASGNKKYPLSLRSCRDGNNFGGESSSNFYGVGAHAEMISDLNLATASNYQHDSKSTSKLFEALKENVYQEVKNLITANESRPHFLIQLFRELQLISSDPLRQRTLQSIQELYNRYIESTLQQEQQEGHVNNVGSNNLLSSNATVVGGPAASGSSEHPLTAENLEVMDASQSFSKVRQQQQPPFSFAPSAESTPITVTAGGSGVGTSANMTAPTKDLEGNELGGIPSSEIISIIMGDIVGVINSVDYINDSVLCKIAGVICNHATGTSNGTFQQISLQQDQEQGLLGNPMLGPSMAAFLTQNETDVISREDFLRHLESWNRTDKDEFISNLENLLNNILLRSSAAEGDVVPVSSSNMTGDEEGQMRAQQQQQIHQQQLQHDSLSSFNNGNNSTTGDISTDNNETFQSYPGVSGENPFSSHVSAASGAVGGGGIRRVYGSSESDKMSNGVSSSNGYALTTYDLAEADQLCDMDKAHPPGAVGGTSNGGAEQVPESNSDNRWRMLQNELDGDLADIMERNRMAEKVAEEQQHQQQPLSRRIWPKEGWQDEDSDGPDLPMFY